MERPVQFEVSFNTAEGSVTIQSPMGLNERAMRDIGRVQYFSIGYGWTFEGKNSEGQFMSAVARFNPEEFRCVRRYFDFANQGISVVDKA